MDYAPAQKLLYMNKYPVENMRRSNICLDECIVRFYHSELAGVPFDARKNTVYILSCYPYRFTVMRVNQRDLTAMPSNNQEYVHLLKKEEM